MILLSVSVTTTVVSVAEWGYVSANGKIGKNQWICSWGPISEPAVEMGINLISSCHVETVVLLSRKAD